MDIGEKLRSDVKHALSIVHYGTYLGWRRNERQGAQTKKMVRPRKSFPIRELILRFAEENAWGYTRTLGELKKMRAPAIDRSTVKNVFKKNGHYPGFLHTKTLPFSIGVHQS